MQAVEVVCVSKHCFCFLIIFFRKSQGAETREKKKSVLHRQTYFGTRSAEVTTGRGVFRVSGIIFDDCNCSLVEFKMSLQGKPYKELWLELLTRLFQLGTVKMLSSFSF